MKHYPLYINGQWVPGAERRVIRAPWDGREVAEVNFAGEAQLEAALAAADAAREPAARAFTHQRAHWLEAIRDGLSRRGEEMAQAICEEAGKPIAMARLEVERGVNTFALAAHEAVAWREEHYPLDVIRFGEGRQCLTRRLPLGPVLGITPYNWPLNLGAHKYAPALAVGCPVVARPASQTPVSTLLLAEIYHEAGVPAGLFNVVPCAAALAERAALDPRIKMVSFTGSPAVGWALKAKASAKRVALELGSNSACVLEPDTDLDFAVPRLALGCFGYAGQICISVQRMLVHEAIRAEFDRRMRDYLAERFVTGDPRDQRTLCGPLIDEAAADKVTAWIEEALGAGARLVAGGRRLAPNLVEPTLLEAVPRTARLWREEVFGPVAVIESYGDYEQALAAVNDSELGINCGVFTNDLKKAFRAFERIEAGCVIINDYPTFRVDSMPYGGVKRSGFGREGVRYAMEELTEIRALILNLA